MARWTLKRQTAAGIRLCIKIREDGGFADIASVDIIPNWNTIRWTQTKKQYLKGSAAADMIEAYGAYQFVWYSNSMH
jgi:hypothetical protein